MSAAVHTWQSDGLPMPSRCSYRIVALDKYGHPMGYQVWREGEPVNGKYNGVLVAYCLSLPEALQALARYAGVEESS